MILKRGLGTTLNNYIRYFELKRYLIRENPVVLDLGCGRGNFIDLLNQHSINSFGVDKIHNNHPMITFSTIEAFRSTMTFDAVCMYHVLEHLDNPSSVLQKVSKLLKPKGILVLECPLIGNLTEKFLLKKYFAYYDPTHHNFFSEKELIQCIKDNGYTLIGRGITMFEFPFTLITTSFKISVGKGFTALLLYLPFKVAQVLGFNTEIGRYYCVRT